jgi:hypothetical protein
MTLPSCPSERARTSIDFLNTVGEMTGKQVLIEGAQPLIDEAAHRYTTRGGWADLVQADPA